MLKDSDVYAMVAVKDIKTAEKFYSETLGLAKLDENPAGITYKSGSSRLFIYPTPMAGTAKSTVATWEVADIRGVVDELKSKDINFEKYEFPGVEYDGDIHIMMGMKAAWFTDLDGNVLGLSEAPKS
jgi:catechol 2,3-dioxygenase-like lactoylglutathione lyase family enzyme